MSKKTYVGFGFGPIQSALFLFEAFASGQFSRYVVAEVDAELVRALQRNGGAYSINIARKGMTDQVKVHGVELYNPRVTADREKLLTAIAEADELATALPSVSFYDVGDQSSVAGMLGQGFSRREADKPAVIYAAENHNHAAEILLECVQRNARPGAVTNIQFLNTVVGKMSGVIHDPATIRRLELAPLTPDTPRAILVEEFNRILISRIRLANFRRGIQVFVEKDDLLPFEEAKLYGHNAIHALIGYLADLRNLPTMADAGHDPAIMRMARGAFLADSGAALIRKYGHLGDPLFTPSGFEACAEDLLERMFRPNLNDMVARVIRDHARKLAYHDRIFGTMRLALNQHIEPRHMAFGAAAAVLSLIKHQDSLTRPIEALPATPDQLDKPRLTRLLQAIWQDEADAHAPTIVELTWTALQSL